MKLLKINRVDLNKNAYGTHNSMPSLTSFNDIIDMNEVCSIHCHFVTKEEAVQFLSNFPKSYKASIFETYEWIINENKYGREYSFCVSFSFNTFHTNETTGLVNESAVNRRAKVIKKIKSII